MKTDGRSRDQLDVFETRLRSGLDTIASTTPARTPIAFDPDVMPLGVDEAGRRRFKPALAAAAVAAVTVTGLLAIGSRGEEPARSNQSPPAEPEASASASGTEPLFRYETPTVHLEVATVEVITTAGTFVPTADVTVDGDPGMPDQYTSLELTWHDGVEQRINFYFASDGATWWADEIRTYDGTDREWNEPPTTGRFFESPLGTPYTGDFDLPNLRMTGMTLQAFVAPTACESPTAPVALIADFPAIRGWTPGGFGASFQIYDTATCTPLPIDNYTFEFTTDDPAVAVVTDLGRVELADTASTNGTTPDAQPTPPRSGRREFDDIKSRVQLNFPGPGSTILHATARESAGTVIGTVDIPITVTTSEDADLTADTTVPGSASQSPDVPLPTTVLPGLQELVAPGAVVCLDAGASQRAVILCVDEFGGGPIEAAAVSADSFVMPVDPANPSHAADAAKISEALNLPTRSLDTSFLPDGTRVPGTAGTTYLVLGVSDIPYVT